VIQDAIDEALSERERFIFDSIVVERLSLRGLGAITSLSKSQVDRIYKGALAKLRSALEDHPMVKEYLTR
jgi:DNA-directed RNA polymerase specialized sigma subunit